MSALAAMASAPRRPELAERVVVLQPGQIWPRARDAVPVRSRILRGLTQVLAATLPDDAPPLALAVSGEWVAATTVADQLDTPVRYRAVVETVISVRPEAWPPPSAEPHREALTRLLHEAGFRLAHRADQVLGRTLAQLAGWALSGRAADAGDRVLVPLSQSDLAALAGASRRLVSQQLRRLETLGRLSTGHGRLRLEGAAGWERLRHLPLHRFAPAWEAWLDEADAGLPATSDPA